MILLPATLPAVIEVPTDDPDDPFFRSITHATIGELRKSVALHSERVRRGQWELKTLTAMLTCRVVEGAHDNDLVCAVGSCLEIDPDRCNAASVS